MAFTEVETYKQLEQEYQQKLQQYQAAEDDYRKAATERSGSDPELVSQYEALASKRREVEQYYERLKGLRSELAVARDAPAPL